MPDPIQIRHRPEAAAAVVNAVLVVLVPLAFVFFEHRRLGAAVGAPLLWRSVAMLLPLAAVTAWRTWVHAKRRRAGQATGWQPAAEAAATAVVVALAYLARGILTRPTDAPAYVIVYAGGALILGAIIGLMLRTTALVTLTLHRRMFDNEPDGAVRRH